MKSKWLVAVLAALGLATVTFPLMSGCGTSENPSAGAARPQPAASHDTAASVCGTDAKPASLDFTLTDMNGKKVNLADFKGRPVLVNFWATWCGPYKLEIPSFVELQDKYRDQGFVVLGVSIDDPPEALRSFAKEYRMNYPVLQLSPQIEDSYGPIYGIPISFLIKRDGTICTKHIGPATKEQFEAEIRALL